ncbi:glycine--tRNA ligase subunit beta [Curvivirga aplysinae]|uniref:glycine--tRNA ligase subunit beta n=1 Tax=Curvivirga aplysinae TaxID=2529852 RepID=UPI0012BCFFA5|nr:glycine--tRNA ligase subunit beta [Curvivirga aplysinae]MTI10426.1 glycine--tRNA ligase subunit beta [Curvivirga aplysinae]
MAELILELFCEEIPAGMQLPAVDSLEKIVCDRLKAENLEFSAVTKYCGPRRLTLVVDGLPEKQPDVKDERKGPKVGAPEQAIAGFLRGAGLESIDQCEQRETPKGAVWFAVIERKGLPTADMLVSIVQDAVAKMPWSKSMRFARLGQRWVRPLRRVNAVFNGQVLAGSIDMNGGEIAFGNVTEGHRFLSEGTVTFTNADEYVSGLRDKSVIVSHEERKEIIAKQLEETCAKEGLKVKDDPSLLTEVAGLVEWPVVLLGDIDEEFMEVPREVLTSSMRANQKYFTLEDADASMSRRFALVANITANDGGAAIINGNERVLRARLADAKFFWDQDLKHKLEDNLPKLEKVVFHAKLGTVAQRVSRMADLAELLCDSIPSADKSKARRAAELSKADLVSDMVFEFPEVQGTMGRYYALKQGEDAAVADAIADHYSPAGPSDDCPTAPTSVAVALAEKIDVLAGFWLIDEKPTGSKDPFALRRAALGVIRLIIENKLRLSLLEILLGAILKNALEQRNNEASEYFVEFADLEERGFDLQKLSDGWMDKINSIFDDKDEVFDEMVVKVFDLISFMVDRLKVHLKADGVPHDHIAAVFALEGEDDLVRVLDRVSALGDFLKTDDGANLLAANKRAANILRAEEKKDDRSYDGAVDADLLSQAEEKDLAEALNIAEAAVSKALGNEAFEDAMSGLAKLRTPLDKFFDDVTVNADDASVRENRLKLLSHIRSVMGQVADFGQIEG